MFTHCSDTVNYTLPLTGSDMENLASANTLPRSKGPCLGEPHHSSSCPHHAKIHPSSGSRDPEGSLQYPNNRRQDVRLSKGGTRNGKIKRLTSGTGGWVLVVWSARRILESSRWVLPCTEQMLRVTVVVCTSWDLTKGSTEMQLTSRLPTSSQFSHFVQLHATISPA